MVEPPGEFETRRKILGDDWIILASSGQVRDMRLKEIGVEPPEFRPVYELSEGVVNPWGLNKVDAPRRMPALTRRASQGSFPAPFKSHCRSAGRPAADLH